MIRFVPILFICALCACGGRTSPEEHFSGECRELYVLLPGRMIIDVAAGADVVLNPAAHDFELFCTPGEAVKAAGDEDSYPAAGDWRPFKMAGSPEELVEIDRDGRYMLKVSARVADWAASD